MSEMSDILRAHPDGERERSSTPSSGAFGSAEQDEPLDQLSPYFREANLPPEGAETPPLWLWASIFGILISGAYYFGAYIGDFSPNPWPQHPEGSPASSAVESVSRDVDGAHVYQSFCQACHQSGGEGVAGVFPPLAGSEWVTGDKGVLIRILRHGMQGEVEVGGKTYRGSMPGWSMLSDDELAGVLTHERTNWGNDATRVIPQEIAAVRDMLSGPTAPWTADELARMENRTN